MRLLILSVNSKVYDNLHMPIIVKHPKIQFKVLIANIWVDPRDKTVELVIGLLRRLKLKPGEASFS